MDDESNQYGGPRISPSCQRVNLSRVTTRELVYHVAAFIAGLRDDFPDRFEHLEQVVQGESNDWKEILEDIGNNLESLQQTLDDCQEGQEGEDGVKALVRSVDDQITEVQAGQDRLFEEMKLHTYKTQTRVDDIKDSILDTLNAQTKSLRAEIRALSRASSQTPQFQTPQFPQFRKLPAEIRFMIWDLALPRRMVCLEEYSSENHEEFSGVKYRFASKFLPPSVAQVCRESRAVACQDGGLVPIRNVVRSASDIVLSRSIEWAWFDPRRDSLYLEPSWDQLHGLGAMKEISSRVQHVTIFCGSFEDHTNNYFDCLFNPYYFPRLKAVDIAEDMYFHIERSDPVLEARLFGHDNNQPISIDRHDQSAKDALMRKLRANHSSEDVDRLERFLQAKNIDGPLHDGTRDDGQYWNLRDNNLHDRWFTNQYHWDVLGGGDKEGKPVRINGKEQPGLTFQWFVEMRARKPALRRVSLLRLYSEYWTKRR